MKKMIVVFAAVAMAACAQATALNWSITDVKEAVAGGSTVNIAAGSYSAYLFEIASKEVISDLLEEAHNGGDWATLSGTIASYSLAHKTNNAAGSWSGATGFESSSLVLAYAVIFDAESIADAKNYYIVNGGEPKGAMLGQVDSMTLDFGSQASSTSQGIVTEGSGWQSIPEPTSGLLLLLGMAGLALKRKVA